MYLYLYCILVGHANCFRPSCQGFYGQDCGTCEGNTCLTTCPAGMYGKACALCEGAQLEPGHPIVALNACSGHGVCNGNGTAGGDGSCACAHGCVLLRVPLRVACVNVRARRRVRVRILVLAVDLLVALFCVRS